MCNHEYNLSFTDLLLNKSLPNPRQLSLKVFVNLEKDDPIWTLLFMQYGQILAHDISLTFGVAQTSELPK